MSQHHNMNRHALRDSFGLMLGFVAAFLGVVPAYDASIDMFLRQIAPYAMLLSHGLWQIIWGLCLFCALIVGTRFIFAMVMQIVAAFFSMIAVRLSLPRQRGD